MIRLSLRAHCAEFTRLQQVICYSVFILQCNPLPPADSYSIQFNGMHFNVLCWHALVTAPPPTVYSFFHYRRDPLLVWPLCLVVFERSRRLNEKCFFIDEWKAILTPMCLLLRLSQQIRLLQPPMICQTFCLLVSFSDILMQLSDQTSLWTAVFDLWYPSFLLYKPLLYQLHWNTIYPRLGSYKWIWTFTIQIYH